MSFPSAALPILLALRLTSGLSEPEHPPSSRAEIESPNSAGAADSLPGTRPLDWDGDLAARMVDGVDRFLLRKTQESVARRARHWNRDFSSIEAYSTSVEPNRKRLAHILGARDARTSRTGFDVIGNTAGRPAMLANSPEIMLVRASWTAFGDVQGEGVLLVRNDGTRIADVIVVPDADQMPEQLAGLIEGVETEREVARRLAESGCRVLVVSLVDRTVAPRGGRATLTNREFLQRPAFELGRALLGYEVQMVLAAVDAMSAEQEIVARIGSGPIPMGIVGFGEGGLVALGAAALDSRIGAVLVSGAFDSRQETWREPVDRNVFGLLDQFGGAELASLIAPRALIIEASAGPKVDVPQGTGGAPGRIATPSLDAVRAEVDRARALVAGFEPQSRIELIASGDAGDGPAFSEPAIRAFLDALEPNRPLAPVGGEFNTLYTETDLTDAITKRQARLLHQLDRHTQQLLAESPYIRAEFMKNLDTSSIEAFEQSIEPYRELFARDVIGRFDDPFLPPDPRSRKLFESDKLTGYEVVLDVWEDVFAYGILVLPKDLREGEKRPVVVCQHGLEGRPQDLADPSVNNPAYNQFALRLAERGFITFAPQNLYIGQDRFRTLQRKANPLGKTLFSIIVPQHQQITDWLKTLPFVDSDRIAFYGLSYGGKSAMRIPPLVKNYCLSICSADFNEWVWKNASTRSPYSYVWTGEYEIFEWDLGSTFNYAEMAALIAPRPFMVERGHFDSVAPDEMVAHEFAKVRHLYAAKLKLPPDSCRIEWFVGPHTIHGVGTFDFLHHHLNWPIRPDQPIVPLNKP